MCAAAQKTSAAAAAAAAPAPSHTASTIPDCSYVVPKLSTETTTGHKHLIYRGLLRYLDVGLCPIYTDQHELEMPPLPPTHIIAKDPAFSSKEQSFHCPGLTGEEELAMILNSYNCRFYDQKQYQSVSKNRLVLLIEFDVREYYNDDKENGENGGVTLSLVVTTCADGLEDTLPMIQTTRKTYLFHAVSSSSSPLPTFLKCGISLHQTRDRPVGGVLPLGIDYVLSTEPYKDYIDIAKKEMGMEIELQLYHVGSVLGPPGATATNELYLNSILQWMQQSLMDHREISVDLKRLPDGYTGKEIDDNIQSLVVDPIRKMQHRLGIPEAQGQPLLVTDEKRCVPPPPTNHVEGWRLYLVKNGCVKVDKASNAHP